MSFHKLYRSGIIFASEHPCDPVLSNCPAFVIEGNDVNCSCQTSGSPPAVVTWVTGGITDNSVLLLRNVSRALDGHVYTCNQYWGVLNNSNLRTTSYLIEVHCESIFLSILSSPFADPLHFKVLRIKVCS